MESDRKPGRSVGTGIGGLVYILSLVVWLMAVPISAASRVVGWIRGGQPTTPIEFNLLGFWVIVYVILGIVGTVTLMTTLGDKNKVASIARNTFVVLAILGGIVWLLP